MMAIREAWHAGLFGRAHWGRNIAAGLVVGVVALPLAMAFAIASGVKPEQGLYTSIIAGLVVALFGGTRIQVVGPTGAFVVILAGITAQYGVEGLLMATVMAGIILILMGVAKLGGVLKFIPAPVIVGFTAGIGLVIFVSQWSAFFGIPDVHGLRFHRTVAELVSSLPGLNIATTALGLLGLFLVLYGNRLPMMQRVPGPLLAMVVVTLVQVVFKFEGVATIASAFGEIPRALPQFALPGFSYDRVIELLPAAFTIAMLGAIESLLSAVVADGMAGTRHDSNQELIGQGLANVIAPLFNGFAATGAIARTATSFRNGANSPIAAIVHSFLLLAILLVLAPLAGQIPLTALAAILFVVAWNMSDVPRVMRMLRTAPRADVVVLVISFLLTVLVDLVVGVNAGVLLAMLLFLKRMSESVDVSANTADDLPEDLSAALPAGVQIYSIEGPFFFAAVDRLIHSLNYGEDTRALIIRLHSVPFMDMTGIEGLKDTIERLEKRNVRVILCEAKQNVLRKLVRAKLVERHQSLPRYFGKVASAIQACRSA